MLDEGKPIFHQIADSIITGILAGHYPERSQVPSTNELAAFHRINPATVGKGLGLLVDQGVLHKRRGIGMFVSEGARRQLIDKRTGAFTTSFVAPLLEESRALGLSLDDVHNIINEEGSV